VSPPPSYRRLRPFERARLEGPAHEAAIELLGALLLREEPDGSLTMARIVETEAYRQDDPASHSHVGRTSRTEPMFRRAGTAYVYRSYGIHWCLNVSAEGEGIGAAVLLRAAAVVAGTAAVRHRRPTVARDRALLRGPGNLTSGLDVDAARHDRGDLIEGVAGLRLADDGWEVDPEEVRTTGRVGVRLAADLPWRFHLPVPEVSSYRRSPRAAPARALTGGRPDPTSGTRDRGTRRGVS
jgi:DNA-3-methyladenine glycosylase